ncbi:MAG: HD domain-containing protein [Alphaproteobacteria bacterium]|nr:HD domain-containing protein [Alphaproteobacteria bacterium]
MRDERIRDPVHNLIKFSESSEDDPVLWGLIQTPPFQRLRRIKQLGFSDFVYPGAGHTRFSHSIGAMQMARRMLEALKRNKAIKQEDEGLRQATLCAVLLHDLGHGPFSHVFEGVSEEIFNKGVHTPHEMYTRKIIEYTAVADVLRKHKEGLFEATIGLFKKDPGEHVFSRIVSGQLDADRLDFLARDRYFTGIGVPEIDLEWLFDSLIIENVLVGENLTKSEQTFVVSSKGRSVLVEYLTSYAHMYSNVYFHKTTRGVETLVRKILRKAIADQKVGEKLEGSSVLLRYFGMLKEKQSRMENREQEKREIEKLDQEILTQYLLLDDICFLDTLRQIEKGGFGEISELAHRFFIRDLLKCFEPSDPPEEIGGKIMKFRAALEAAGIKHDEDITSAKGYKQFEISGDSGDEPERYLRNILVKDAETGEKHPIGTLNPGVFYLESERKIRFYFSSSAD